MEILQGNLSRVRDKAGQKNRHLIQKLLLHIVIAAELFFKDRERNHSPSASRASSSVFTSVSDFTITIFT
jgi:hypothetical protein